MNQLNLANMTAAKICHEIANYLSIMRFLQEDLSDSSYESKELKNSIDGMALTLDFFRTIYTNTSSVSDLKKTIIELFKFKKITLIDKNDIIFDLPPEFEKVIAGILYIILKSSQSKDSIEIKQLTVNCFSICSNKSQTMFKSFCDYLKKPEANIDAFNVFIFYILELAKITNIKITLSDEESLCVNITKK